MAAPPDLTALDERLNELAKLYQFRSLDDPGYGSLTVSQSYCLRILYFRGARTMTELASELDVRLSTMTGIVDQLEAQRLVERVGDPHDRRKLRVSLSAEGRALYRAAHDAFLSHLAPLLAGRTAAARRQILDFLARAIDVIQGWRDNPRKVRRHGTAHPAGGRGGRGRRPRHLRPVRRR
jgi:DNA-binding MarR family transcriptional regulator